VHDGISFLKAYCPQVKLELIRALILLKVMVA
jgi:hypothetical protein